MRPISDMIFEFAFFPDFNKQLKSLSELAAPEYWEYEVTNEHIDNKFGILYNYMMYTFKKIAKEYNKSDSPEKFPYLIKTNDIACFSTGLYSIFGEVIYAYFEKNESTSHSTQPYFFKGFFVTSDNKLNLISKLPEAVVYLPASENFLYNTSGVTTIRVNLSHILGDEKNIERLPSELQGDDKKILMENAFRGSIDRVQRELKENSMIAAPQYNNKFDTIQLLLPLKITKDEAQLVLVVDKVKDENGITIYMGRTCLTPIMAYNNSRQIMKPNQAWLLDIVEKENEN